MRSSLNYTYEQCLSHYLKLQQVLRKVEKKTVTRISENVNGKTTLMDFFDISPFPAIFKGSKLTLIDFTSDITLHLIDLCKFEKDC